MKKNYLYLFFFFGICVSNAQFQEDFEKGVPGKLKQVYLQGETTLIDFGLSSIGVDKPLSGDNSAVFFNGLAVKSVSSSLETPNLDLINNSTLEFNYLQKVKNDDYFNKLILQFSNDNGLTWNLIDELTTTLNSFEKISIDLLKFNVSNNSKLRFVFIQNKVDLGYPIVIDDIKIYKKEIGQKEFLTLDNNDLLIYPNPSNGDFKIYSLTKLNIIVFDYLGRTVYENKYSSGESDINLTNLQAGQYLVKMVNEKEETTKKIIIK